MSLGIGVLAVFGRAAFAAAHEAQHGAPMMSTSKKTLVIVQLAGGVDQLDVLIPFEDPLYPVNRPTLNRLNQSLSPIHAYGLAFHPNLSGVEELWRQRRVAFITNVGYPNPSRSHFRSMDIMQTASLSGSEDSGWLARHFNSWIDDEGNALKSVNVGSTLPLSLMGGSPTPSLQRTDIFKIIGDPGMNGDSQEQAARTAALLDIYPTVGPMNAEVGLLLETTAFAAQDSSTAVQETSSYEPRAQYPIDPFARRLKILAQLITQDVGLRVCHIRLGGFDTHSAQNYGLDYQLSRFDEGIRPFFDDLAAWGWADNVLMLTWSEFGRRVAENGSGGTDHGAAGVMMAIGRHVRSGIYGGPPELANLLDGDLRHTIDFRQVYATVLEDWLETSAAPILGGQFPTLPFIGAPLPVRGHLPVVMGS